MRRLNDYRPQWGNVMEDFTPETGGVWRGKCWLSFVCPNCGPPGIIYVQFHDDAPDQSKSLWQANLLPDGTDWPNRLTLSPSINNTLCGHGRRQPKCSFHANIISGNILP